MNRDNKPVDHHPRDVIIVALIAILVTLGGQVPANAQTGGIASPTGTMYSVSHRLRLPVSAQNPNPACATILAHPNSIQPDDIVTFDGVPESLRTYILGTTPTVDEFRVTESSSSYTITIVSSMPSGLDLFPGGFTDINGDALTDACFTIGLDDLLDWTGLNTVVAAALTATKDGTTIVAPLDVTNEFGPFGTPWDGFVEIVLPGIAGQGVNRVELQFLVTKDVTAPSNDLCTNASVLSGGSTVFSNIGADTDGPAEPLVCTKPGSVLIGSDIWYHYTATCTGDLTIDLCDVGYDANAAIYAGCNGCPTVPPLACNDDTDQCGPFGQGSLLKIPATQGECFTVRVGGFLADQGTGIIRATCDSGACCVDGACRAGETEPSCAQAGGTWFSGNNCSTFVCPAPPPVNDECLSSLEVFAETPVSGTTASATGTAADSSCSATDDVDVWYDWTSVCDGRVTIDLCDSLFDTTLAVFDGCGGPEIACNDDSCPTNNASVTIQATTGTTYLLRVAGSGGETGDYTLNVSTCSDPVGACCAPQVTPFPLCQPTTESICLQFNGTFLGANTVCLGDLDGNGTDDACETCNAPVILSSNPPNCAIDARYPSDSTDALVRTGWDQIELTMDCGPSALVANDFQVTVVPAGPTPPAITNVALTGDTAVLTLNEPIPTQAWTCIEILSSGSQTCVAHLPADAGGDGVAAAGDILDLIDHLNGTRTPPLDTWQCDIDRSGQCQAPDILGVIDLLNGAGAFDPWLNQTLAVSCPSAP